MFAFSVEILQIANSAIHEAATFQVNECVRACAVLLEDTELLAKRSTADMVYSFGGQISHQVLSGLI